MSKTHTLHKAQGKMHDTNSLRKAKRDKAVALARLKCSSRRIKTIQKAQPAEKSRKFDAREHRYQTKVQRAAATVKDLRERETDNGMRLVFTGKGTFFPTPASVRWFLWVFGGTDGLPYGATQAEAHHVYAYLHDWANLDVYPFSVDDEQNRACWVYWKQLDRLQELLEGPFVQVQTYGTPASGRPAFVALRKKYQDEGPFGPLNQNEILFHKQMLRNVNWAGGSQCRRSESIDLSGEISPRTCGPFDLSRDTQRRSFCQPLAMRQKE